MNIFNKLYSFTTENISGYIDKFDLNDKTLLTVGSSSDQVINASLKDIKNATILDISPNTKNYYYLKLACLMNLDMNEFLTFLCPTHYKEYYRINHDLFDINVYNKIKDTLKELDTTSYDFWDNIFNTYNSKEISSNYFLNDIVSADIIKKSNPYLNNNILYDEAKIKMKSININFIIGNIKDVKLTKKYDNIWLSNVCDYLTLDDFTNRVIYLSKKLNIDGNMLVAYLYKISYQNHRLKTCKDYFNVEDLKKQLSNHDIKVRAATFDGVTINNKDAVLIYKKH